MALQQKLGGRSGFALKELYLSSLRCSESLIGKNQFTRAFAAINIFYWFPP